MNTYISHQVFSIDMQPKQNISIPKDNENISKNVGLHEDEESTLEERDIEKDHRNLGGKNSDIKSCAKDGLSGRTFHAGLLGSESSSSLRKVRFSDQKFSTGTFVSNSKYNHLGF